MTRTCSAKKAWRRLDHQAGAVPGQAVGVDGAAVGDVLQRPDRVFDDLAARLAVDGGHEAHAAGVLFRRGLVGVGVDQALPVGLVLLEPGHAACSSAVWVRR
jgi:hypothetical protein